MKTLVALASSLLFALAFTGCATPVGQTIAKFNAAAAPRLEQDAQVAIEGASGAVAAQLAASLEGNGTIDPSVLGSAAAVGAITKLINLDIDRANGSAQAANTPLHAWVTALRKKHPDWERTYRALAESRHSRHHPVAPRRLAFSPIGQSRLFAATP